MEGGVERRIGGRVVSSHSQIHSRNASWLRETDLQLGCDSVKRGRAGENRHGVTSVWIPGCRSAQHQCNETSAVIRSSAVLRLRLMRYVVDED